MEVYRLARKKFATGLSGKGAALKGARWNSTGVELIYTAANRSLAMAEVAVHFSLSTIPADYVMVTIFIPDDASIQKLNITDLPSGWNVFPHPSFTQNMGDDFVADGKYCILQVPSAVTKGDFNYLINPNHPQSKQMRILSTDPFPFDKRIFK